MSDGELGKLPMLVEVINPDAGVDQYPWIGALPRCPVIVPGE